MKFLKTNLVSETATVITASSTNLNFPASNLKNPLRSKRWRSAGTFVVDATNNKINFKEAGGGLELTATITSGTYSVSGLQTEIATRMQSAGAQTYTITYSSSTGLWTIASAGSYLSLLNLTGTNHTTSLLSVSLGFPASDKTGALTYTGSLIACHTEENIVFDMQTAQDITSVVLLWPKEDGIRLSESAVLTIQANATNTWASPALSQTITLDNTYEVASYHWASIQSYRYWRLKIVDPENPYLFVELGVVWIGENVSFNEPENGFKFTLTDGSVVTANEFGHEYVDEYPLSTTLDFRYDYISYATMQALENAFRENGKRKPVLVVLDETETVFDKDHFLIYGKMAKEFPVEHVMYDIFKGGIKLTELG